MNPVKVRLAPPSLPRLAARWFVWSAAWSGLVLIGIGTSVSHRSVSQPLLAGNEAAVSNDPSNPMQRIEVITSAAGPWSSYWDFAHEVREVIRVQSERCWLREPVNSLQGEHCAKRAEFLMTAVPAWLLPWAVLAILFFGMATRVRRFWSGVESQVQRLEFEGSWEVREAKCVGWNPRRWHPATWLRGMVPHEVRLAQKPVGLLYLPLGQAAPQPGQVWSLLSTRDAGRIRRYLGIQRDPEREMQAARASVKAGRSRR